MAYFTYASTGTEIYLGNGIINADAELWKLQRKAGLDFLNKSNLQTLTDVALPKYLDSTIADLNSRPSREVVDLEAIFLELTTQLMGRMAYDVGVLQWKTWLQHVRSPVNEILDGDACQ
jgi:hypothetical protein